MQMSQLKTAKFTLNDKLSNNTDKLKIKLIYCWMIIIQVDRRTQRNTGWFNIQCYAIIIPCIAGLKVSNYERDQPFGLISISCNWVILHNDQM